MNFSIAHVPFGAMANKKDLMVFFFFFGAPMRAQINGFLCYITTGGISGMRYLLFMGWWWDGETETTVKKKNWHEKAQTCETCLNIMVDIIHHLCAICLWYFINLFLSFFSTLPLIVTNLWEFLWDLLFFWQRLGIQFPDIRFVHKKYFIEVSLFCEAILTDVCFTFLSANYFLMRLKGFEKLINFFWKGRTD